MVSIDLHRCLYHRTLDLSIFYDHPMENHTFRKDVVHSFYGKYTLASCFSIDSHSFNIYCITDSGYT